MFIKFGDKTKKIIVKNSKDKNDNVENQEENVIYLDSDDKKDRRIKIINKYSNKDEDINKE
tara:strand:+ start:438 stop:620 length:183 start_codon:yes stop_codon:yes gene_type:complete